MKAINNKGVNMLSSHHDPEIAHCNQRDKKYHTILLLLRHILNSLKVLMHTLSRSRVYWFHELINTVND